VDATARPVLFVIFVLLLLLLLCRLLLDRLEPGSYDSELETVLVGESTSIRYLSCSAELYVLSVAWLLLSGCWI